MLHIVMTTINPIALEVLETIQSLEIISLLMAPRSKVSLIHRFPVRLHNIKNYNNYVYTHVHMHALCKYLDGL